MFTAQDFNAMLDDDEHGAEVARAMVADAYACIKEGKRNAPAVRLVKDYLDALDYVELGAQAVAEPHNHGARAVQWLRRPYMSEGIKARISDAAMAEALEGLI